MAGTAWGKRAKTSTKRDGVAEDAQVIVHATPRRLEHQPE